MFWDILGLYISHHEPIDRAYLKQETPASVLLHTSTCVSLQVNHQVCWATNTSEKKTAPLPAYIIFEVPEDTARVNPAITDCQQKIFQKTSWHFWHSLFLSKNSRCYLVTAASILFNSWLLYALNFNIRSEAHQYIKMFLWSFPHSGIPSDPSLSRCEPHHRALVSKPANNSFYAIRNTHPSSSVWKEKKKDRTTNSYGDRDGCNMLCTLNNLPL